MILTNQRVRKLEAYYTTTRRSRGRVEDEGRSQFVYSIHVCVCVYIHTLTLYVSDRKGENASQNEGALSERERGHTCEGMWRFFFPPFFFSFFPFLQAQPEKKMGATLFARGDCPRHITYVIDFFSRATVRGRGVSGAAAPPLAACPSPPPWDLVVRGVSIVRMWTLVFCLASTRTYVACAIPFMLWIHSRFGG